MPEDMRKLKLSQAFENPEASGEFEWTATMINVNIGHNRRLLEKCRALKEYSIFTGRIRENASRMPMPEAVGKAVEDCIRDGVLRDLLEKNQREVKNMCLTEFDEEVYRQICREEGREEGLEEGRKEGVRAFLELCREMGQTREETVKRLNSRFSLTLQQAQEYAEQYW